MLASLLMVASLPHVLKICRYDTSALGCSWEIVSILQTMKEDDPAKYEEYKHYLDYIGDTGFAVDHNSNQSIRGMYADKSFDVYGAAGIANANRLKRDYLSLAMNEPKYFLRNKWEFIQRTMGIHFRLGNNLEWKGDPLRAAFGIVDTKQRDALRDAFNRFMTSGLLTKPYRVFAWTLFLLLTIGTLTRKKINLSSYWLIWWFAAFYYLGFLITTQNHEIRYFFPSLYLLLLGGGTLVIDSAIYAIKKCLWAIGDGGCAARRARNSRAEGRFFGGKQPEPHLPKGERQLGETIAGNVNLR